MRGGVCVFSYAGSQTNKKKLLHTYIHTSIHTVLVFYEVSGFLLGVTQDQRRGGARHGGVERGR